MVRRDQTGNDGPIGPDAWPVYQCGAFRKAVQVWAAWVRRLLPQEARKRSGSGTAAPLQVRGKGERVLPEEAKRRAELDKWEPQRVYLEPPDWDKE